MRLDRSKDYGVVYGSEPGPGIPRYVQGESSFDCNGDLIVDRTQTLIETDDFQSARAFLENILQDAPLSKAQIFKTAETNNQDWNQVKLASEDLGVVKFKFKGSETWKLSDDAAV